MKRPFDHNLIKVKNPQCFAVVQNVKYFYKEHYLANSILAFYLEPYFGYFDDSFTDFIASGKGSEEDWFEDCRLEKEVNGKVYYGAIYLQDFGYLHLNSYLKKDWEDIKYDSFLPSFRAAYYNGPLDWLTDELREKFKNFYFFYFKEIYPDVLELANKFYFQLEKNNGEINNLEESLVGHFSPERIINLHPFFSKEDLQQIVYGFSLKTKPAFFNNTSFITTYEDYKKFLLDFYGEKGSCCKYTNFNENFLKPYKNIEELMYADILLGAKVAEKLEGIQNYAYKYFPFPFNSERYAGWVVLKRLTESLSEILNKKK